MQGRRRESAGQLTRLAPIAPRQDHDKPQSSTSSSDAINQEVRRNRLPPRSRNGCWTCRTRKVKCDELKPECGQCTRLGHTCDYNPRLAFRDDTPRILERMQQDVSTSGSIIWDPSARTPDQRFLTDVDDSLPPFASLTTDEERERMAEAREPGSYFVLANPDSFASLPEYRDDAQDSFSFDEVYQHANSAIQNSEAEDPDIIILRTFEEPGIPIRRGPVLGSSHSENLSTSPRSYTELRRHSQPVVRSYPDNISTHFIPILGSTHTEGRDAQLLRHYRTVISPLLTSTPLSAGEEDIFERQAKTFPALYHAIMALSALSMAHKTRIQSADPLEHYQKVIPALKSTVKSTEDSYSDGALLSHYILLLYEIATAGSRESNMWQHHSDQLLRIIILRRRAQVEEPYNFIIWSIFCIDIYALLSTTGNGSFVEALTENNIVPVPYQDPDPFHPSPVQILHPEERPYLSVLVQLNQEILMLASHIGQMARALRSEAQTVFSTPGMLDAEALYRANCRTKVQALQQMIENTRSNLKSRFPEYLIWLNTIETLPPGAIAWVQHAYLILRACIIYAHTSMYPGQLQDSVPNYNVHVNVCSKEILHAASMLLSQNCREVRFVVLPLFLAGIFTTEMADKDLALQLITAVELHSYGGSVASVKVLLQTIYHKQNASIIQTGVTTSVDWVEEMELSGQRLIITGL